MRTVISILKRWLAPDVQSWGEVPLALLKVALAGAVLGPLIAMLFGWLFLPFIAQSSPPVAFTLGDFLRFAAPGGMIYALLFYSIFGLAIPGLCRLYNLSGRTKWLAGFGGWIVALVLLSMVLPGGEWFGEAIRARSLRILGVTTIVVILLGMFHAALDRARAQKAAAEARAQVKALQAQMNPHFFFNTLNTIYALIAVDPQAAQRTVGLLADMSRHAFSTAQSDLIPLTQELDFAGAYLEIEKIRFGSRLQCELPDRAQVEGIHVPALSVQPLVENAIRHGIAKRLEGGTVSVEVDRRGAQFSVTVRNDCGPAPEHSAGAFFREGHALENIRVRLRLYYGDRASIAFSFPRPDAVAVTVTGPVQ
jgi:two-component system sensor histidine kinase AlgZ